MPAPLEPVPTPPAHRWRQIRMQLLPLAAFALVLVAVAVLWTQWVAPPTLIGEAEADRAELRAAAPGTLVGLNVALFQSVAAGQVVGYVQPQPPAVLEASLAVIRAEIDVMRATLDPVSGQQRVALDRERLQLDWMGKRVELAALRGQLLQAETTFARTAALHQSKMVTDERFDEIRNTRDALLAQVKAQAELVEQLEPGIRRLSPADSDDKVSVTQGLRAAIQQKESELRLAEIQLGPQPLLAPIDGIVTQTFRRNGEAVAAAEPILAFTAAQVNRITGFLRPPLPLEPKRGARFELRTRTQPRRAAVTSVAQVGHQYEPIPPTLLAAMRLPVSVQPTDLGLRVQFTVPAGFALRPGEHVDLVALDD